MVSACKPHPDIVIDQILRDVVHSLNLAVLACSDDGSIIYRNREATRLCARFAWGKAKGRTHGKTRFEPFLRVAPVALANSSFFVKLSAAESGTSEIPVYMHVMRLIRPGLDTVFLITVASPTGTPLNTLAAFGELHRLSRTEQRILVALFGGLGSSEIAERERMSIHTVRAHTKAIMRKTEVRRQSMLLRQVAAFARVSLGEFPSEVSPEARHIRFATAPAHRNEARAGS